MRFRQSPEEQHDAAITRVVDDPQADASPELRRQAAAERRVASDLRTGGPAVPDRLVKSIDAKVRERYGPEPSPRRHKWSPTSLGWRPAIAVAATAAVCAAIVVVVIGVGGSGSSGPSIPAAAELAFAPSTGPAPGTKSATLLDVSYGGVTYPNYHKFSTHPTGTRTDRIGGRPALTVFYRLPDGTPLSYTVFSGKAVPLPANARSVRFEGVPLKTFTTSSGLSVVTLVRYGRTCVLAAKTKPNVVLGLAAAPVLAQHATA